jgi:parvulin-like peptidyl-prolyl isomerase
VLLPGVKLDQTKVQRYYEQHPGEFMYPAFYKLESIGFGSQRDAEAAVAKLRAGTDFRWLNANAEGKLAEGKDSLRPGNVVSAKGMTPTFAKAIEGAKQGDYRTYAASDDQAYAVRLVEVVPPAPQPFEEVRDGITQKLYGEAMQKSIEDLVARLRKVHPVQVYLTRIGG